MQEKELAKLKEERDALKKEMDGTRWSLVEDKATE